MELWSTFPCGTHPEILCSSKNRLAPGTSFLKIVDSAQGQIEKKLGTLYRIPIWANRIAEPLVESRSSNQILSSVHLRQCVLAENVRLHYWYTSNCGCGTQCRGGTTESACYTQSVLRGAGRSNFSGKLPTSRVMTACPNSSSSSSSNVEESWSSSKMGGPFEANMSILRSE